MLSAIIPLVMAVIGALVYAISTNPKVSELGRLLFAAGVFALAFSLAGKVFTL